MAAKRKNTPKIKIPKSVAELRHLSVHEAGHCIVGTAILPRLGGRIKSVRWAGNSHIETSLDYGTEPRDLNSHMQYASVLYSGLAAEQIILGARHCGAAVDLTEAYNHGFSAVAQYGLADFENGVPIGIGDENRADMWTSRRRQAKIEKEILRLLGISWYLALETARQNRNLIEQLSADLIAFWKDKGPKPYYGFQLQNTLKLVIPVAAEVQIK